MIQPIDLRLLAGAIGAWGVCLVALKSSLLPWCLVILGAGAIVGIKWPYRNARHRVGWRGWLSQTLALGCLISLAVSATTLVHLHIREDRIERILESAESQTRFNVVLVSEVKRGDAGVTVHAQLHSSRTGTEMINARIPMILVGALEHWRVGQQVEVSGSLSARTPGVVFLRVRAVHHENEIRGVAGFVNQLRDGIRAASGNLAPHPRGLLPGVSIGDTRRLTEQLDEAMKITSLAHITAVSGAHVAVVLATILAVLARLRPLVKGLVALVVLGAMVLVVLPTPSVLRASSMGALTLVGLISNRPRLALPGLFAATITLLIIDPWLAESIGFALSAVVTAGILALSEPLAARLGSSRIARIIAVPVAAQIACAPLLLTFDSSISVYSVPANMLAMPALAPATILGLLSAVVSLISLQIATVIATLGGYFTMWIASVALFFAHLPGARLPWLAGATGVVSLIGLSLGAYVLLVRGTLRRV